MAVKRSFTREYNGLRSNAQQNAQDDCRKVLAPNGPSVLLWSIEVQTHLENEDGRDDPPRRLGSGRTRPFKTECDLPSFLGRTPKLSSAVSVEMYGASSVAVLAKLEDPKVAILRDGHFAIRGSVDPPGFVRAAEKLTAFVERESTLSDEPNPVGQCLVT